MGARGTLAGMDPTEVGQVVGFDPTVIDAWLPTVADITPPITWERRLPMASS